MNILLLYVSRVSGHCRAAEAIEQALDRLYPQIQVRKEDLFKHGNPLVRKILDDLYYTAIKVTPWFWDFLWNSNLIFWLTYGLREFSCLLNSFRLYKEVILPFNPQVVVCTHGLALALCSTIKRQRKLDYLLGAVPTDYSLHPYWPYDSVDLYFLAHEEMKGSLRRKGIPQAEVQICGIPISPIFSEDNDKERLKSKWQIRHDLFTVLLMGGGQGIGPLRWAVDALNGLALPIQLLIVTGTNDGLKKELQEIEPELNIPVKIVGYTKKINELMEISDLLISKPGGLTIAEALAKDLPLGILDSLAGQERKNQEFLLKKKIAFNLQREKGMVSLIREFLDGSFDFENWQARARELVKPQAALDIAKRIVELAHERFGC
jgi:processive 1,2-diacylglycerol beta-glucosyltransferase